MFIYNSSKHDNKIKIVAPVFLNMSMYIYFQIRKNHNVMLVGPSHELSCYCENSIHKILSM